MRQPFNDLRLFMLKLLLLFLWFTSLVLPLLEQLHFLVSPYNIPIQPTSKPFDTLSNTEITNIQFYGLFASISPTPPPYQPLKSELLRCIIKTAMCPVVFLAPRVCVPFQHALTALDPRIQERIVLYGLTWS